MNTTYPCPNCGDELIPMDIPQEDREAYGVYAPAFMCLDCDEALEQGVSSNTSWWYEDHLLELLYGLNVINLFVEPALDLFWYERLEKCARLG